MTGGAGGRVRGVGKPGRTRGRTERRLASMDAESRGEAAGRASGAPRSTYAPWTLYRLSRRVLGGEDFRFAVREFLDDVNAAAAEGGAAAVEMLVVERPEPLGSPELDAFLGGLAEHLAVVHGFPRPDWCLAEERFLERWWFPHRRRAFDALAVRDAPAAFRRRGVFVHPSTLSRC